MAEVAPESDAPTSAKGGGESQARRFRAHEVAVALRNGLKLGSSILVTWSVALVVRFEVPRFLGPKRTGHLGFSESFATMFFAALGLGIDTYIVKEVSVRLKHAADFMGGVVALRLLMGAVFFTAMLATLQISERPSEVIPTAAVFGVTQLLLCNNASYAAILQASGKVGGLAITNVVGKLIWGAGLLAGIRLPVPLYVLALPMLGSEAVRAAFLLWATRREAGLRLRLDVKVTRAVIATSLPYFLSAMAITLLTSFEVTALGYISHDDREVGWFAAAQNLATLATLLYPLFQWVVMPMLARAQAHSSEEMTAILRRCIEGIVIVVAPVTVLISAGADFLVHLAFGDKFAPAATGLSILSLVFMMTYINSALASALVIGGKSWTVTIISAGTVIPLSLFTFTLVPLGRRVFGMGGECAGAAMATIATEFCVNMAMIWSSRPAPFDARNVSAVLKSIFVATFVLVLDRFIRWMGPGRLACDLAVYVLLALSLRIVRVSEVVGVVRILRPRAAPSPIASS